MNIDGVLEGNGGMWVGLGGERLEEVLELPAGAVGKPVEAGELIKAARRMYGALLRSILRTYSATRRPLTLVSRPFHVKRGRADGSTATPRP